MGWEMEKFGHGCIGGRAVALLLPLAAELQAYLEKHSQPLKQIPLHGNRNSDVFVELGRCTVCFVGVTRAALRLVARALHTPADCRPATV